jgi:hypothetical protein
MMRCPFTVVIFSLELTHDLNILLPLLVVTVFSYGFTALTMRRSILTEKVIRRGYHLSREYAVDPLEILFVREVMRTNVVALRANMSLKNLAEKLGGDGHRAQRLYPVVDGDRQLVGVVTHGDLKMFEQKVTGQFWQGSTWLFPYRS